MSDKKCPVPRTLIYRSIPLGQRFVNQGRGRHEEINLDYRRRFENRFSLFVQLASLLTHADSQDNLPRPD